MIVDITVRVTCVSLNIRAESSSSSAKIGSLPYGAVETVHEVVQVGTYIWGRLDVGWICLKAGNALYTNLMNFSFLTPTPSHTNSGFISTFTVPYVGNFWQTKHDYESSYWGNHPRVLQMNYKGMLPETVILRNKRDEFHSLSEAWQRWWFELLRLASDNTFTELQLIPKWESLTADSRAFTDNHAVQNGYHDFITGRNPDGRPIAIKSLTTGGNQVKVLSVNGTLLTIECLDVSKAPPAIETVWLKKPFLYQWAGQCGPVKLANGTYRTSPFPQLTPYGTPVPVVSSDGSGTQIIDKSLCKQLANGKTYQIYNT